MEHSTGVIQLTPEQHRFELWAFLNVSIFHWMHAVVICDPFWLNLWVDAESRIQRAGIKLHSDFQLCGGSVSLSPCCSWVSCSINSHFSPLLQGNIVCLHILYWHILICNMGCYENYMLHTHTHTHTHKRIISIPIGKGYRCWVAIIVIRLPSRTEYEY